MVVMTKNGKIGLGDGPLGDMLADIRALEPEDSQVLLSLKPEVTFDRTLTIDLSQNKSVMAYSMFPIDVAIDKLKSYWDNPVKNKEALPPVFMGPIQACRIFDSDCPTNCLSRSQTRQTSYQVCWIS